MNGDRSSANRGRDDRYDDVEDTDRGLIEGAQTYLTFLKQQFSRTVPDPALASAWEHFYRLYNRIIERFAMSC